MKCKEFRSLLDDHGMVYAELDNGDRFRLLSGDVELNCEYCRLEFDCGDEAYRIPVEHVHHVEVPKSDKVE